MFKTIQNIFSGITKKISTQTIIIFIIFLVIIYALYNYSSMKLFSLDGMGDGGSSQEGPKKGNASTSAPSSITNVASSSPSDYVQQSVVNPSDLLPKGGYEGLGNFNDLAPTNNSADVLQAGYHIGMDTVGQSLKNPNYQLRSDPIIEKREVSPWMNSTITPDYGRVPLEIGGGTR